jgi:MFS family permease
MAAMMVGAWFIRRVPERKILPPEKSLYHRLRDAVAVPSVRSYVIFLGVRSIVGGLPAGFGIVMLKLRGMDDNMVLWMIPVAAVGHMVGLNLWAGIVDRHGSRPVITIATLAQALLGLSWLMLPYDHTMLIVWAVLFFVAAGFLDGAFMMGRTQAMMDAIPTHCQADGFTLGNISMAVFAAIGAYAGTLCFEPLTAAPDSIFGVDYRLVYLSGVQACLIGTWIASRRLTRYHRETPTSVLMGRVLEWVVG